MSRNIRLLGGYLTKDAVATADTTVTGYDAKNAVVLDRNTTWKATNTSAVRLKYHTAAFITPTGLGIAMSNWSAYGTCKLQHSTDGASWTDFFTLTGLPPTDYDNDYFAKLTSAPSKEWWALYWAAPSAAPEVGLFYLGALTELARNDTYPRDEIDNWNTDLDKSEGGILVAEDTSRDTFSVDMNWKHSLPAERDTFRAFLATERGPRRPFFFALQDETGSTDAGRAYLMRARAPQLVSTRRAIRTWGYGVRLDEEV